MIRKIAERLVGSWRLVSYHSENPDGSTGRPFGEAIGRLTYDAGGRMSGQVMRRDRPAAGGRASDAEIRRVYSGYVAYFGTYDVVDDGARVVHHVEGALNPDWVGGDQVRTVQFDGNDLVLRAAVTRPEGIVTHVLRWEKV